MSSRIKTSSRAPSGTKKSVRSDAHSEAPRASRTANPSASRARLTITDIARLAGVSKKTVSRVINQEPYVNKATRERIETIIAEHGYQPDPDRKSVV